MSIPRNDLCPSGSGRKYKKCCGNVVAIRADRDPRIARADAVAGTRDELHAAILRFARSTAGPDWLPTALTEYLSEWDEDLAVDEVQLALPWALFHYVFADMGESMAERLRDTPRNRLSGEARALLNAEIPAYFSIWAVSDVVVGVGFTAADLLTRETRFIADPPRATYLQVEDAILARVVDWDGLSTIGGMHPVHFPASIAENLAKETRRPFRVRTRPVPVDGLRDPDRQLDLLDLWRSVLDDGDDPAAMEDFADDGIPTLTNTDGDLLAFITDRFDFTAARREQLVTTLATIEGISAATEIDAGTEFVVIRAATGARPTSFDSIVARIEVRGGYLLVETNSTARADGMKKRLINLLGATVRDRVRSAQNTAALMQDAIAAHEAGHAPPPIESTPEIDEMLRQFREQYMQGWLDDTIPALGGLTPRQAAADVHHHAALRRLLDDVEEHERRLPPAQRCDMRKLRMELGM